VRKMLDDRKGIHHVQTAVGNPTPSNVVESAVFDIGSKVDDPRAGQNARRNVYCINSFDVPRYGLGQKPGPQP
jgi:hypothetical protein